mmetsp:Transcript_16703/g.24558  ORF Transcript_16703/g.24558 Transcript_16703/m.24558 type:complete len:272 (-) Transcript_16703:60-875(-)
MSSGKRQIDCDGMAQSQPQTEDKRARPVGPAGPIPALLPLLGVRLVVLTGATLGEKRGKLLESIMANLGATTGSWADLKQKSGELVVVTSPTLSHERLLKALHKLEVGDASSLTIVGDTWISSCAATKSRVSLEHRIAVAGVSDSAGSGAMGAGGVGGGFESVQVSQLDSNLPAEVSDYVLPDMRFCKGNHHLNLLPGEISTSRHVSFEELLPAGCECALFTSLFPDRAYKWYACSIFAGRITFDKYIAVLYFSFLFFLFQTFIRIVRMYV